MPGSIDTDRQRSALAQYERIADLVNQGYGYELFLVYGTLLGAVRDGTFLDGDPDIDAGYLSKQTDGAAAADELKEVGFSLIDAGFVVECRRTHLRVAGADGSCVNVFHLYFDADGANGRLRFPFGVAGSGGIPREEWQGTAEVGFGPGRALVPADAKQVVAHVYGPDWRRPDPGFDWSAARTSQAADGVLPESVAEEIYWSNFYAHATYDTGSTFFAKVNGWPELPDTVIDLGCGDGRDSYAFGTAGRTVVGIDRSEVGVRHATKKAHQLGHGATVSFSAADVGDADRLRSILDDAIGLAHGDPVVFYARFFLHSIPADVQDTMMRTIQQCARPGDYFAAEFRTDKDEKNAKVHTKHYRRFQNGPAFGAALRDRYGFTIVEEQKGTGLSPYKGEDPELYRVIARRDG